MRTRCSFLVGYGQRMKFWKDKWYGDNLLSASFPFLFGLANSKDVWVEDVLNYSTKERVGILVSLNLLMIGR